MYKIWCVYGKYRPWGIGKIIKENDGGSLEILYSEKQQYPAEVWDPRHVFRFPSLKQAMDYYVKKTNENKADVLEGLAWAFEKDYKTMTEKWSRKDYS